MRSFRGIALFLIIGILLGAVATYGLLQVQQSPLRTPALASGQPAPSVTPAATPRGEVAVTPPTSGNSEDIVVGVYERVSPSVVNITNSRVPQGTLGEEEVPQGSGSGLIVDAKGYVLTNHHVVEGATSLDVTFAEGTTVSGKVLGSDPASDLALVQVEIPSELLTSGKVGIAKLGDSDALRVGQMAIAIGNPFGFERTVTVGIISGLSREIPSDANGRPIRGGIQTDAAINPGNSGGPLLNAAGEVIGINSSIESPVRGSVGVGFAVPINTAKRNLETMAAGREVQHPRIGIMGYPVTQRLAERIGLPVSRGIYVAQVTAGSPGEKAGLRGAIATGRQVPEELPKGGDVITAIDGQPVVKIANVAEYIELKKRVGESVKLSVKRGNEDLVLDVTLDAWPAE